ncbi:efflux RND transporter periplasmic adaptor subunit [Paucibacter sp. APW11]|uniref:Efflux RND transporter periplasmic adaptor subunit n=1 Tax=Roseateles aquae TaxID=3077235 RepID=A0ABU3PBF1_9BURK|nr:efflux RND transporter periplasmic adaptor subunit [Paucibacter sp. APW11]MDT8999860.1 efflux RND transporter periplasmic adaptor subunit [Paucibacter sp. APW11]
MKTNTASSNDRAELLRRLASPATATGPAEAASPAGQMLAWPRLPRWAWLLIGAQAAVLAGMAIRQPARIADASVVPTAQATPAPAPVAAATKPTPGARLEASGFVTATRMATVSARTMGQISELLVEEGARVEKGQVLARISSDHAQMELRLAEAQQQAALARIQSAEAEQREAQRNLQREISLQDQQFSSEARVSKARTSAETALAAVQSARADAALVDLQVQRQRQLLDDYVVRAPFAGVVLARNAQAGEIVAPSGAGGGYTRTGICTIVDMKSLEIVVDVNEEMITRVQPDQQVTAELYSHKGWRFPGRVLRVMPSADRAKATVRARIQLLTDDPRILPDMAVKVAFL